MHMAFAVDAPAQALVSGLSMRRGIKYVAMQHPAP
jgi:hypothetical protein